MSRMISGGFCMHDHNWKQEVFTVPNLLSLLRLFLIPLYCGVYLRAGQWQEYAVAGSILSISCLTDCLDGIIARKTNSVSTVGKILDPLADKATQLAVTVCLVGTHPTLKWLLILFLLKETLQTLLGLFFLVCGMILPGAMPAGKISSAVFFSSLVLLVMVPTLPESFIRWIAVLDGSLLVLSFISYTGAYLGKHPKLEKWRE